MRPVPILTAVLAVTAVIAIAYVAGAATAPAARTPAPPAVAPATPPSPPEDGPEAAALAWLHATHHRSWQDPGPLSWAERARAATTGPARADLDQLRTAAGPGGGWDQFAAGHCTTSLRQADAVVPPEAPRTPDQVWVQAAGTVLTQCADAPAREVPVAATVAVWPTERGWRVARQLA